MFWVFGFLLFLKNSVKQALFHVSAPVSQADGKSVSSVLSSPLAAGLTLHCHCWKASLYQSSATDVFISDPYGTCKPLHFIASKPSWKQGNLWRSWPVIYGQLPPQVVLPHQAPLRAMHKASPPFRRQTLSLCHLPLSSPQSLLLSLSLSLCLSVSLPLLSLSLPHSFLSFSSFSLSLSALKDPFPLSGHLTFSPSKIKEGQIYFVPAALAFSTAKTTGAHALCHSLK